MLYLIKNNQIIAEQSISNKEIEKEKANSNDDLIYQEKQLEHFLQCYEVVNNEIVLKLDWETIKAQKEAELQNATINDQGVQVPKSISKRQAREIIIRKGLFQTVETAIEAIGDETEKLITKNYWDHEETWDRDSTTLNNLAVIVQVSQDELDQMFIEASKL